MGRAADLAAGQQPLRERDAVVGAVGVQREDGSLPAREQHGLVAHVADQQLALPQRVGRKARIQVGPARKTGFGAHRFDPRETI
jgi:hypothetical protein